MIRSLALRPLSGDRARGARTADRTHARRCSTRSARPKRADEALALRFDAVPVAACRPASSCSRCSAPIRALLTLLVTIMAAAPRLARSSPANRMSSTACSIRAFLAELPTRDYLSERLDAFSRRPDAAYEEVLDRLRIFAPEQKFLIGVRLLTGAISARACRGAFSDLADLSLCGKLDGRRPNGVRRPPWQIAMADGRAVRPWASSAATR